MHKKYMDYLENIEEEEATSNYLDIWNINPFHKDIDTWKVIGRIVFLAIIIGVLSFFIIKIYSKSNYLVMAISFPLILLFYENIFNVYNNLFKSVHGIKKVNPFKELVFWINDPETLVVINNKSSLILAIRIFKLNILPEYVHSTFNHFLDALYTVKINFSYQIVQTRLIEQKFLMDFL